MDAFVARDQLAHEGQWERWVTIPQRSQWHRFYRPVGGPPPHSHIVHYSLLKHRLSDEFVFVFPHRQELLYHSTDHPVKPV